MHHFELNLIHFDFKYLNQSDVVVKYSRGEFSKWSQHDFSSFKVNQNE